MRSALRALMPSKRMEFWRPRSKHGQITPMGCRSFRSRWSCAAFALVLAPFMLAAPLAGAQSRRAAADPCAPDAPPPKKGQPPPKCPEGQEVPVVTEPSGPMRAADPPPAPTTASGRRAIQRKEDVRAVVSSPGFRMMRDGSSKVFVQVHGKPTIKQFATRGGVTYVLPNCRVPVTNNRHALMTQYFNTPISGARLRQAGDNVLLTVDLRANATPQPRIVELVPNKVVLLEVVFPPGNYYRQIPTDPAGPRQRRGNRHRDQDRRGGSRGSPPPSSGGNSVLGPPAP